MVVQHFVLNESIPVCPDPVPETLKDIAHPTTAIIFVVYAVTSLIFATFIAFKYNSVKVFNKKIRTQNISNTLWIIYYVSIGVKTIVSAALYSLKYKATEHHDDHPYGLLFDSTLILSGINAFTLCLSLNHQRKYRSSAPPNAQQVAGSLGKETEPLLPRVEVLKRLLDPIEIVFFILFAASLILYYICFTVDQTETLILVFVGSYAVQRLPILILALVIVAHRNGTEGPTRQSKVYLFFAALFHLVNELPIFFWSQLLPGSCVLFHSLSWIDILIILNYISLILFFLFLRTEYLRNMEECIWTTVSQIQDTFDFRRF